MPKELAHGADIKGQLMDGVCQLGDIVGSALGPKGRSAVLPGAEGPLISGSGAFIAGKVEPEGSFAAAGGRLLAQLSRQVGEAAGDGTATAVVLAQRMIREGLRLAAAGADPVEMKKGMQGAAQLAAAALKRIAVPAADRRAIVSIASAAAGDPQVGRLIAEALARVCADGAGTGAESDYGDLSLEVTEGMEFDRGYLLPEMAADQGGAAELDHPYLLVTDETIRSIQPLLPLLEAVRGTGRPLLILADGVEGDALGALMVNRKRGILDAVAVHPPGYGQGRRAQMEDIAILTGAVYLTRENGCPLEEATVRSLGGAASVKVTRSRTVITGGEGDREAVARPISVSALRWRPTAAPCPGTGDWERRLCCGPWRSRPAGSPPTGAWTQTGRWPGSGQAVSAPCWT